MSRDERDRPGAAAMRQEAAAFVERATRRNRLPLDYSVASLRIVDFVIDGLRRGASDHDTVEPVLFGLGAYVGEVLVRRAGGVWMDLDMSQQALFGQRVGIRMPDSRVWNPLGKVVNRYTAGNEESLRTFYLTLHGRPRTEAS